MDIQRSIVEKLKTLPEDKQQEVLDSIEFIQQKAEPKRPRRSLKGLWADLGVEISEEDISEIRREMWGISAKAMHWFRKEGVL